MQTTREDAATNTLKFLLSKVDNIRLIEVTTILEGITEASHGVKPLKVNPTKQQIQNCIDALVLVARVEEEGIQSLKSKISDLVDEREENFAKIQQKIQAKTLIQNIQRRSTLSEIVALLQNQKVVELGDLQDLNAAVVSAQTLKGYIDTIARLAGEDAVDLNALKAKIDTEVTARDQKALAALTNLTQTLKSQQLDLYWFQKASETQKQAIVAAKEKLQEAIADRIIEKLKAEGLAITDTLMTQAKDFAQALTEDNATHNIRRGQGAMARKILIGLLGAKTLFACTAIALKGFIATQPGLQFTLPVISSLTKAAVAVVGANPLALTGALATVILVGMAFIAYGYLAGSQQITSSDTQSLENTMKSVAKFTVDGAGKTLKFDGKTGEDAHKSFVDAVKTNVSKDYSGIAK